LLTVGTGSYIVNALSWLLTFEYGCTTQKVTTPSFKLRGDCAPNPYAPVRDGSNLTNRQSRAVYEGCRYRATTANIEGSIVSEVGSVHDDSVRLPIDNESGGRVSSNLRCGIVCRQTHLHYIGSSCRIFDGYLKIV
jgi:hypothetical protein